MFENIDIANSFHWLVHLDKENEDNQEEIKQEYEKLYTEFMDKLLEKHSDYYDNIMVQQTFRKNTVATAYEIREHTGKKPAQVKTLKETISKKGDRDLLSELNNG